jgi:hypothetical protein
MIILIKSKKVTLDCFTTNSGVAEFFPISNSVDFYPDWWKNLPKYYDISTNGIKHTSTTIKTCSGFIDLYKNSLTIPMWSEFIIEFDANNNFKWISPSVCGSVLSHDPQQLGPKFKDYSQVKLISPWIISEKSGINFHFTGAFWNQLDTFEDFIITPGVVNYKNQVTTHINLITHKKRLEFKAGQPMVNIIPMTEKKVQIKIHQISEDEYKNKMNSINFLSSFIGSYIKNKKIKKTRESKCPFGFK